MVCTYCGSNTHVTNSRHQKRPNNVWRRRQCLACGAVFSTLEHVDYEKSWVVQYPSGPKGSKKPDFAPFLRDKLLLSIYKACQHREAALQDAIALTDSVISKSHTSIKNGSLQAIELAQATYDVLKRFDQPAAVSYMAFHRDVL